MVENLEDRIKLPLGVRFKLPNDDNILTKLRLRSLKMILKESITKKIEGFKQEIIAIAEQYEQDNRDNMLLINEISSRRDWSDLTAEAQENRKSKALADKKAEQEKYIKNRMAKFENDLDLFENSLTAELFTKITGLDKLQSLAEKMGITPEFANSLLEDVAGLQSASEMLGAQDSFTDLVLRKQIRNGGNDLSSLQKESAQKRINGEGSEALEKYRYIKHLLSAFKGQMTFVNDVNLKYSPQDLEQMNILGMVKDALEKSAV